MPPFTTNVDVCARDLGSLSEGSYFVLLEDFLQGGEGPPVYHKDQRGIHVFPLGILGGEPQLVNFSDTTLVMRLSSSLRSAA